MKIKQLIWNNNEWLDQDDSSYNNFNADLTIVFGERMLLENTNYLNKIKKKIDCSNIVICSTSGNIIGENIYDNNITATAIQLEKSSIQTYEYNCEDKCPIDVGKKIGQNFINNAEELKLIMILSDGQNINGSDLLSGINEILKGKIPVTGGLAGDNARFEKTLVGLNTIPTENKILVIGFYGQDLKVGHGSRGGWDPFGPKRIITRSNKNILFELDGKSALNLYKKYLGDRASELPGSALLFPLELTIPDTNQKVVRTILSINEDDNSMIFAGNLPEGATVQLMKANFDKLIDGSIDAAEDSIKNVKNPELAILISCVGRKLVLGQKVDEEIEEAKTALGDKTKLMGFYSYGEISPLINYNSCLLHNQTMTITTISEK